jgi:drug/metabolite transporter (DMT)-like permease
MSFAKFKLPLALIGLLICWPSAFPAIRIAVRDFTPLEVTAFRLTGAAVLMLAIGLVKGMKQPGWHDALSMAVCGVVGLMVYNLGLGYGLLSVSAATAGFIVAIGPVFIVLLSALFLKERFGWKTGGGIGLSFAGAALIALSKPGGFALEWGAFYVLIAAFSAAVMTLTQKPLLSNYSPYDLTTYMTVAAALSVLPLGWQVFPKAWAAMGSDSVWALLHLAIIVSFIGYLFWGYVLMRLPASRVASFMYLIPISATFLAWVGIGERPAVMTLAGGGVVILGVAIVNVRRAQKKQTLEVVPEV